MAGYDVSIKALANCGFLDLRGGNDARQACSEYLDVVLPTCANTLVKTANGRIAFCISSNHWLLQVADGNQMDVLRSLECSSADISHSFVDVSDLYARIQLSGPESRDVLAQGVSIDIHPRVFPPGSTARTGIAKTTTQIHYVNESPTYDILVFSSFRQYMLDWLAMAAAKS